jgi:hypothetical protein
MAITVQRCQGGNIKVSDLLQFFESRRQFQIILFLLIGSGTALSQLPPFQFLQKPRPYPVGSSKSR